LAGSGWQLEVGWEVELPCELMREWCFLGSGVLVKQLRFRRKRERERVGWGVGRSVLGAHPIQVTAPNVRKNAAHRESP
jgi:hypothetical protein